MQEVKAASSHPNHQQEVKAARSPLYHRQVVRAAKSHPDHQQQVRAARSHPAHQQQVKEARSHPDHPDHQQVVRQEVKAQTYTHRHMEPVRAHKGTGPGLTLPPTAESPNLPPGGGSGGRPSRPINASWSPSAGAGSSSGSCARTSRELERAEDCPVPVSLAVMSCYTSSALPGATVLPLITQCPEQPLFKTGLQASEQNKYSSPHVCGGN